MTVGGTEETKVKRAKEVCVKVKVLAQTTEVTQCYTRPGGGAV